MFNLVPAICRLIARTCLHCLRLSIACFNNDINKRSTGFILLVVVTFILSIDVLILILKIEKEKYTQTDWCRMCAYAIGQRKSAIWNHFSGILCMKKCLVRALGRDYVVSRKKEKNQHVTSYTYMQITRSVRFTDR